jgi:hypothetical protein
MKESERRNIVIGKPYTPKKKVNNGTKIQVANVQNAMKLKVILTFPSAFNKLINGVE